MGWDLYDRVYLCQVQTARIISVALGGKSYYTIFFEIGS